MALPVLPLAAGAAVLVLLMSKKAAAKTDAPYSQAPADGSKPPTPEPKPPAKTWKDMPPALQEQVAAALGALGVSPATGELGPDPVSADAIRLATQTAALCESQGFYDVARELNRLAGLAAKRVPTPKEAAPIQAAAPPGLSPAQIEAIARTLTLDRDPKSIEALIKTLQLLPPSPQRDNFITMAQALLLQLAAAQSTTQTMHQIDQVIRSPGIAEVHQAVQPLPPQAIPIVTPPPVALPPLPAITALPAATRAAQYLALRVATGTRLLSLGTSGPDVKAWQTILGLDGFSSTVDTDGKFGPKTVAATKAWQAQRGLSPDGKVGGDTRSKIGSLPVQDKAVAVPTAITPKPASAPAAPARVPAGTPKAPVPVSLKLDQFPDPAPNARTLQSGSKGPDVESWQRILISMGYPMGTFGPGKDGVDGQFGATADKQTRAFQQWGRERYKDARITADGKVGPTTRRLVLMRTAELRAAAAAA